ncbi:MAG: serpin family protein [Anaerolineae bacterium]|nr:serpin family protein [Thermoflexales bacterium]MDW8408807.1 serpin family protein [Anaerolineae bacterium]
MSASSASLPAKAINRFGFRLLAELVKDEPDNLVISPAGLAIALMLACNGAAGETQQAIMRALGIEGYGLNKLNQSYAGLLSAWPTLDRRIDIRMANSVWVSESAQLKPAFRQLSETIYRAAVQNVVFDTSAVTIINDWAAQETGGRIRELLGPGVLTPETLMVLLNAVYFKGAWMRAFDPKLTQAGTFTRADGTTQPAMLMQQSGRFDYFSDEQAQVVRLPYGEGRAGMVIALPRPEVRIGTFVRSLGVEQSAKWAGLLMSREGNVVLPRFKVESALRLNESLGALGMEIAFTGRADFSAMFVEEKARISLVQHQTFVEVNEEGAEAAAATAAVLSRSLSLAPPPFRFVADRPFCFAIEDSQTGAILFLGIVTHL